MRLLRRTLLCLALLLGLMSCAHALDLTVSYQTPVRCGAPTTFTLSLTDAQEGGIYLYAWNFLNIDYDGYTYAVFDNSRTSSPYYAYREDPRFEFTFRASGTYHLRFYVMDKTALPYKTSRRDLTLVIDDADYPDIETIADRMVEECRAAAANEYELALALQDRLLKGASYDHSLMYCSPEGVLARGSGTCESYQRAYAMLLDRAGIANARAEGSGHTWNLVRMEGEWYHVDPTWDQDDDDLYFGLTDEMILLCHPGYEVSADYPCTSLACNKAVRGGQAAEWAAPYMEPIQQALDAARETFSVPAEVLPYQTYVDTIKRMDAAWSLSGREWTWPQGTARFQARYDAAANAFVCGAVYTVTEGYVLSLPEGLTELGADALKGTAARMIRIPASCGEAVLAQLPTDILWSCAEGSAAQTYAEAHGIRYQFEPGASDPQEGTLP